MFINIEDLIEDAVPAESFCPRLSYKPSGDGAMYVEKNNEKEKEKKKRVRFTSSFPQLKISFTFLCRVRKVTLVYQYILLFNFLNEDTYFSLISLQ